MVYGALKGAAHKAVRGIWVVQETDLQWGRIFPHVNGLDKALGCPVPHIQAAAIAVCQGKGKNHLNFW